jgi:hypothetical protein
MTPDEIIRHLKTGSCNRETRKAVEALITEAARLEAIVDKWPKTNDGKLFAEYAPAPGTRAWCVWRYDADDEWRVSACHMPEDPDEASAGFGWVVEDAEDEGELLGIYSTREAAEAAKETLERR